MKILRKTPSMAERNRREYRLRTAMGERPERAAQILHQPQERPLQAVRALEREIAQEQARDALRRPSTALS